MCEEEFELTFLMRGFPEGFDPARTDFKEILDIYLPSSSDHALLRVRKSGDAYEITKKTPVSGADSSHQNENTIPLSEEEFSELSSLAGKRVRKRRYYYSEGGTDYEIDVFQDGLEGLVLVDVEFSSNEAKAAFVAPGWVLADVTQEKAVAGGVLCGKSYADLADFLGRYSYTPSNL